jgi:hypothetical protein
MVLGPKHFREELLELIELTRVPSPGSLLTNDTFTGYRVLVHAAQTESGI